MKAFGLILGGVLFLGVALFAWSQHSARLEAERKLGLDASRIVSVKFTATAKLKVAEGNGTVLVRATDKGWVTSEQTTLLPFSVGYSIDMTKVSERSYRWDGSSKTLTVDLPDVSVEKPNIDEAKAEIQQKGPWISRRAGRELARQTSERAAIGAEQEARKSEHLDFARQSARSQVIRQAESTLKGVGLTNVSVVVSFPWEPKNGSNLLAEQWDRSRRIEDVLHDGQTNDR